VEGDKTASEDDADVTRHIKQSTGRGRTDVSEVRDHRSSIIPKENPQRVGKEDIRSNCKPTLFSVGFEVLEDADLCPAPLVGCPDQELGA
jgi:hypothetical protein